MTTDGHYSQFDTSRNGFYQTWYITRGADGALWFTDFAESTQPRIGRITTAGVVTAYYLPDALGRIGGIASGPDGKI